MEERNAKYLNDEKKKKKKKKKFHYRTNMYI